MLNNKTIMQCSIATQPEHVIQQLMAQANGWEYVHFNDETMMQYVIDNPVSEFPEIAQRIKSYERGAHRVDLFRYYYLYINGGVFIDSDMMIYQPLDSIVLDYDFVSIIADKMNPGTIFNGFLACDKENEIIYEALKNAYNFNPSLQDLKLNTNAICKKLYEIVKQVDLPNIKLYREKALSYSNTPFSITSNKNSLIAAHYYVSKSIPTSLPMPPKTDVENLAKLISLNIAPDVKYKRLGSFYDGGYVLVDDLTNNDFCVSFGIESNIDFEEDFLKIGSGVHAYDNSITSPPEILEGMSFYKETVGEETSLRDVLSRIDSNADLVLKMDIEGGEYSLVNNASSEDLNKFRQIAMEVHGLISFFENPNRLPTLISFFEKINKTHAVVFVHPNNHSGARIIDNYMVPNVLEMLYVRRSDYNLIGVNDQFEGLTRRCHPFNLDMGSIVYNYQ